MRKLQLCIQFSTVFKLNSFKAIAHRLVPSVTKMILHSFRIKTLRRISLWIIYICIYYYQLKRNLESSISRYDLHLIIHFILVLGKKVLWGTLRWVIISIKYYIGQEKKLNVIAVCGKVFEKVDVRKDNMYLYHR